MSELTKRIVSGVLLAVLLLVDLWLGSWWFLALLAIGAILLIREYWRLVLRITPNPVARLTWMIFGVLYIGLAIHGLWGMRAVEAGLLLTVWLFFAVWGTDVGAYVFGRTIGGPKIAPAISPSKTWAGLFGAIFTSSLVMLVFERLSGLPGGAGLLAAVLLGTCVAVLGQAGDFFESWMKRRAGVKDSGGIIPGHGGLFDRLDGLLPVAITFPYLLGVSQ